MTARHRFRVLTRTRTGYDDAVMHDIQLQSVGSGAIIWTQTFSDAAEAEGYRRQVEDDLDDLSEVAFREKWHVPSTV